jgi:signal transduction histidine kinase
MGEGAVGMPLVHQGEVVGELRATPRRGERLSPRDLLLLGDLGAQLAVALHALRLTDELRRSRERLVLAREEERRRIRRDLHDSLGPTLTGVAMQADAARNLLRSDPDATAELLSQLRAELTSAIAEIRKLVYGLRPPALDELGLVEALRQQAERFTDGRREGSMAVDVEASAELRDLPAAVEVAAFRIAAEAINNVARHAGAAHCSVKLKAGESLEVEVLDDGVGWQDGAPSGVGLASMRERAEELGGRLVVGAAPGGGSRVLASLPLRGKG